MNLFEEILFLNQVKTPVGLHISSSWVLWNDCMTGLVYRCYWWTLNLKNLPEKSQTCSLDLSYHTHKLCVGGKIIFLMIRREPCLSVGNVTMAFEMPLRGVREERLTVGSTCSGVYVTQLTCCGCKVVRACLHTKIRCLRMLNFCGYLLLQH